MRKTLLILLMLCSAWVCHAQFWDVHSVKPPVSLRNAPDTVTLYIIGDVMMHSRQLEYDHHSFLSRISHKLGKADFAIANMEFPLGGRPYTGYPVFSVFSVFSVVTKSEKMLFNSCFWCLNFGVSFI